MNTTLDSTIGEIVAADFRTAAVFHRHGIDFCCRGGRLFPAACQEQGVDPERLLAELDEARRSDGPAPPDFASWDELTLIDYIVSHHHEYVRAITPTLIAHTEKVARVHGGTHPELGEVSALMAGVAREMATHMLKEEHILFPHIHAMAQAAQQGCPPPPSPFGTVENPIRMMETEHESAGEAMARIRELTGGFVPPSDACATYRVCLQELDAFEQDLHQHVHLENNLLFPKARRLDAR
ncbi:MAG TPA: iron-sulfur cluster repair di-iron protein [Vicinamibacterales bacterium]|nr:iron-sulfur cluster repair di-iron protein [Vicinamibacterales bacterium]